MQNTKELMHCHCGTNNRAPRWIFTDPCKPEVRPGAREESASPAWLAAPAMNARYTTIIIIISFATMTIKGKERYRWVFEIQKSGDKTSSGEIGLYIRTNASPKVGQDQVSGGVSVLCWHAAQVKTRGNLEHWGSSGKVIILFHRPLQYCQSSFKGAQRKYYTYRLAVFVTVPSGPREGPGVQVENVHLRIPSVIVKGD